MSSGISVHRVEDALRTSEERFRLALSAASIVVFNQDCDLRYTWVGNPALGLRPEEAVGKTDEELLGAEAARPLTAIKRRVLLSGHGERQEVHVVRGEQAGCFDLLVEPVMNPQGEICGITCVAVDISERKRVEAALRESEAIRHQALACAPGAVHAIDREYRLLFQNQRQQKALADSGAPPVQVGETVLSPASPPETRAFWRAAYDRALQGEPHRLETEWTNREGQAQVFENAFSPLRDAAGTIIGVLVVARDLTARRQRERALHEREELHRRLFAAESDAIFLVDCETGRFVEVNPAAVRIYGYSREEFLALKVSDISAEPESSRGAIQRGETSVALRWHHRRDGTLFPVEIAGGYLEWSGRRMHVAAIRDISERKRAEAALQESEQRFAAVIRNSPVAIGISRLADGVFLEVNQAFADLHGYAREEIVGHTSLELGLWHSGNREEVLRNLRQHKGRQIVEMHGRRKDGEIRCLLASIDSVQVGGELCMVGFLSDITERKQMEKALRESEEHYRLATGAARVALWRADLLQGRFETDGALERMLGYAPGELGTDPSRWRAIVHPEDRERTNRLWQQASGGESKRYDCDYRVFHKDGSVRWVQVLGHALRDGLGRTVALTGTTLDITAHKNLEAERTAALARLAVVEEQERHRISRELHDQTAQRLVALAVELKTLETNLAAGRSQGERVRSLRQAVDDLQQQVHRIAWDLRAGELVEFGLERSLREYIEEWSERARVPVDCAFRGLNGERLPTALEATVYRVAQEALANVEKHAQARRVNVLLEREPALVRLIVEDDGCGFDVDATHGAPDDTPRLGLLGMRERVKLAGGTLLVESSPGSGTTILVRIPIVADAEPFLNG